MIERSEGVTKIYNRFHNSDETNADIQKFRDLHVELDHAVAVSYGWKDLCLDHAFRTTDDGIRYTINDSVRVDIIDRLHELNHERATQEAANDSSPSSKIPKPRRKNTPSREEQPSFLTEMPK